MKEIKNSTFRIKSCKVFLVILTMLTTFSIRAQEVNNEFSIDTKLLTRGELRVGGFNPDNEDRKRIAHFILGQYRINLEYRSEEHTSELQSR